MTTKTLQEKFEEAFLNGRSRDDVMVSSQLHLGADGEYFNFNTKVMFNYFKKGAASVVVELPNTWQEERLRVVDADEVIKAIEAAGGTVKS